MEAVVMKEDGSKEEKSESTFQEFIVRDSPHESDPEYQEYRKQWENNAKDNVVNEFPVHLDLESTSACNLKCVMCFQSFNPPKYKHMELELFKKIIDEGMSKGLKSIKLQYRGEPLLHPKIVEMVKYAKDKGVIEVMFNTNANLLSERIARGLIEAGMDKIICSVDGHYKEFYEKIRIGGNFDRVVGNIKRMQQLKKEYGVTKPRVRVQMVKLNRIEDGDGHVRDYVAFWKDISDVVGVEDENDWDYSKHEKTIVSKEFQCTQPWQRLFVMSDGKITLCCGDIYQKLILGNAHTDSIGDIWMSKRLQGIRGLHLKGDSHKMKICAECGGRKSIIQKHKLKWHYEGEEPGKPEEMKAPQESHLIQIKT